MRQFTRFGKLFSILLLTALVVISCTPAEITPDITSDPVEPIPTATSEPVEDQDPTVIPEPADEPTEEPAAFEPMIALEQIAEGLTSPVAIKDPGDGSGRLFVVDQVGLIYIIDNENNLLKTPFLDLRDNIVSLNPNYDERGLLGLAFHPDFASNGRFFVYYSAPLRAEAPAGWAHTNVVSEFSVSDDSPNFSDPTSEILILALDSPQSNHNAGPIIFGPDGYLYIAQGDGGGGNDTGPGHVDDWYDVNDGGNAQNIEENMLGSILRIDIDNGDPYSVPADNPGLSAAYPEIWAYGFRNPWRMAFDPGGDHELFVGDVGQNLWEEVSIVQGGGNYGWNVKEGTDCFSTAEPRNPDAITDCPDTDPLGNRLIDPIIEFANSRHPDGGISASIVGGTVYRGSSLPGWDGRYVFGHWSASSQSPQGGILVATRPNDDGMWDFQPVQINNREDGQLGAFLLALGRDSAGEIYILTSMTAGPSGNTGSVYRIIPPDAEAPEENDVAAEVEITMVNNTYQPRELTVEVNTTVTWINEDGYIHDVVSGTRGSPAGIFESPDIGGGETFSFTFDEPGTYDYFCTYHPGMAGTITVTE